MTTEKMVKNSWLETRPAKVRATNTTVKRMVTMLLTQITQPLTPSYHKGFPPFPRGMLIPLKSSPFLSWIAIDFSSIQTYNSVNAIPDSTRK